MSGLSGTPQQDSRDSEGVQPMTPENQQQREFLDHISVSPSSLVTPRQQQISKCLQPDTPTPAPNHPPSNDEGVQGHVTQSEDVQMRNQSRDGETDQNTNVWFNLGDEGLQGHVTANASSAQDWTTAEYTNPHYQVEPVQSHGTANASSSQEQSQSHLTSESMVIDRPLIGHVTQAFGSSPHSTPSTPQTTVPPEHLMARFPYEAGQHILRRTAISETTTDYVNTGSSTPVTKHTKLSTNEPMTSTHTEAQ